MVALKRGKKFKWDWFFKNRNILLQFKTGGKLDKFERKQKGKKKHWKIYGILLPKLFWPTVRKNCSRDQKKYLKFEAEGREFAKFLRSLAQFVQRVKGQNNFW